MDYKFTISPEVFEKCEDFAKNSVSTNSDKYAKRNQFNVEKIKKDIRNGKIAEECVYEKLVNILPNLSKPDHQIYDKKNKSWSADLQDQNIKVAVKSQDVESAIHFGESWVFQYSNNGKFDTDQEVFNKKDDNHYVTFVSLNVPKRSGEIKAIVKINWLHDKKLFKEMKKPQLRNNKIAVYFNDLLKFENELFQL